MKVQEVLKIVIKKTMKMKKMNNHVNIQGMNDFQNILRIKQKNKELKNVEDF